jgi:hypothetical protein
LKLHAVFEITENQELGFRERLQRLGEEINHGGLEIEVSGRPELAVVAEPEVIQEIQNPQEKVEVSEEVAEVIEAPKRKRSKSADSGAREETSGDILIVRQRR